MGAARQALLAIIDGSGDGASAAQAISDVHNDSHRRLAALGENMESHRVSDRVRVAVEPWLWRSDADPAEDAKPRAVRWSARVRQNVITHAFHFIGDQVGMWLRGCVAASLVHALLFFEAAHT